MAGGSSSSRSLEETPTWAVAVVCFVLVFVSIVIEYIIHLIGKWLKNKHKRALFESLEKIKSELMLLGFISLLLTVLQGTISEICIPESVGATWHPCSKAEEKSTYNHEEVDNEENDRRRKLLSFPGYTAGVRRILAGGGSDKCAEKGKVPLISYDGIHQLHIFIFVLAVFHVLYCITTLALGRLKMKRWKKWEKETKTIEYQFTHDPERFRYTRDTSFGRRHLSFWSKKPFLLWICLWDVGLLPMDTPWMVIDAVHTRGTGLNGPTPVFIAKISTVGLYVSWQFVISVAKVDYLTLRHGFIMAHLAPQSQIKFDFQKYIKRSLEEDFKVVVGISPLIWFVAVVFLLLNTHGLYSYLWLPFIPLIIILLVGTKLQVIITKMGLRIQERGEVVKGVPVVELGDDLFWFSKPSLVLHLINLILFQNAFQLAFFAWSVYEFGINSCFHKHTEDIVIRITMGVLIQFLCSYVTLPLYALVTQMGSTMKPTIFNDRVAKALRNWHQTARKHVKQRKGSVTGRTPGSTRPSTPTDGMSPVHLLRRYRSEVSDSLQTSPRQSNYEQSPDHWDGVEGYPSTINQQSDGSSSHHHQQQQQQFVHRGVSGGEYEKEQTREPASLTQLPKLSESIRTQHEIAMGPLEFSFDKRDLERNIS